jgi:molecular chaperone DnaJ
MKDPYSILGVSSGASDAEIKNAYRNLMKKYHPDNFQDDTARELAEARTKEINAAYDELTKGGASSSGGASSGFGDFSRGGYSGEFAAVRTAINSGNLNYAEQLLAQSATKNAEWYYLMGTVYFRRGWHNEAINYYERATAMVPGNAEYRSALNYCRAGANYNPYGTGTYQDTSRSDCDSNCCTFCTAWMCLEACCNCH